MQNKRHIVVLTGAGISAESGLKTFRDAGGLWEGFRVEEVASPEAFAANPEKVLAFYNQRRAQAREAAPNAAHTALVELEAGFQVDIVTQNVDDLHERAGSSHVLHLHGQLNLARSTKNAGMIQHVEADLNIGDLAPDGAQLRPHIVWFGEPVPMIEMAAQLVSQADMVLVIGTSLAVYPAAGLLDYTSITTPIYVVDPNKPPLYTAQPIEFITAPASEGVPQLVQELLAGTDSLSQQTYP
ncbi:MAG: NAD-dependent deacylase [Bacteroidota bacterium]